MRAHAPAKAAALAVLAVAMLGAGAWRYERSPARLGLQTAASDGPATLSPVVDDAGAAQSLNALRGKVVILNLWASWCGPCLEELPALDRLSGALPADRFAVVAVTKAAPGDEPSRKAFAKLNLAHLKLLFDPSGALTREVGARGTPTTLILGADGAPIAYREGSAAWDSAAMVAYLNRL